MVDEPLSQRGFKELNPLLQQFIHHILRFRSSICFLSDGTQLPSPKRSPMRPWPQKVPVTLPPVLVPNFLLIRPSSFDDILASSCSSSVSRSCFCRAVLSNINHSPNTVSVRGIDNAKYIHKLRDTCPFKSGVSGSVQGQMYMRWETPPESWLAEKSLHTGTEVKERHTENG